MRIKAIQMASRLIRGLFPRLHSRLGRPLKPFKLLSFWSAVRLLACNVVGLPRMLRVWSPSLKRHVYIRSCSTDFEVMYEAFAGQPYAVVLEEPVDVIVDAGANIGCTVLYFAQRYPNARIIAIEPERGNIELLKHNTSDLTNVEILPAALSGVSGSVELVDPGLGAWGFAIRHQDVTGDTVQTVEALTMLDVMRQTQIEQIDLLKLDIEGAEVDVFETAEPWINGVRAVVLELHDRFRPGCQSAFREATRGFQMTEQSRTFAVAMRCSDSAAVKA